MFLLNVLLNQDDLRCHELENFVHCIRIAWLSVPLFAACRCDSELGTPKFRKPNQRAASVILACHDPESGQSSVSPPLTLRLSAVHWLHGARVATCQVID